MKIPLSTVLPRFYVATSDTLAFSSWSSLVEAQKCIKRFQGTADAELIQGIVMTSPAGRSSLGKAWNTSLPDLEDQP